MESGYPGLDIAQILFAVAVLLVFIGFALWGFRTRRRIQKLEEEMRDFRELEPEGFDEEENVDSFSEGAMLEADAEAARQGDILEHRG